jgi:hypothetical protein
MRIYNPTGSHPASELSFRHFGPLLRFDHQSLAADLTPWEDPDRGVWYGSLDDLDCAVVELFGDERLVVLSPFRLARPHVKRRLRLLDLRENGAMLAGTVAEIAKSGDVVLTWEWARYFYEQAETYEDLDGLIWLGAHNDGECIVLFERAEDGLSCEDCSLPLSDRSLRDGLLRAVREHLMMLSLDPLT